MQNQKTERKHSEVVQKIVPISVVSIDDTEVILNEETKNNIKEALPKITEDLAEHFGDDLEHKDVKIQINYSQLKRKP